MSKLDPPWLRLLNALQSDWRDAEILKENDPDPYLERQLRAAGKWPPDRHSARNVETALHLENK